MHPHVASPRFLCLHDSNLLGTNVYVHGDLLKSTLSLIPGYARLHVLVPRGQEGLLLGRELLGYESYLEERSSNRSQRKDPIAVHVELLPQWLWTKATTEA
jgi:hypothetical protein